MTDWVIWLVVMVVLVLGEVRSGAFVAIFIAMGAAVAALLGGLGLPLWAQAVGLVGTSVVGIGVFRRPLVSAASRGHYRLVSGARGLVGQQGVVVKEVGDLRSPGLVRVQGENWTAQCDEGETIPEGTLVMVLDLDRTRLIVRKY